MPEPLTIRFDPQDEALTVHIPIQLKRIGGRKAMIAPAEVPDAYTAPSAPRTGVLRALSRAYRWQRLLENRTYSCVREIAEAEKINESYVSRVLRLTLLAPDVVEQILNGAEVDLERLFQQFPSDWKSQHQQLRLGMSFPDIDGQDDGPRRMV